MRFAIYYAPQPSSLLWRIGCSWLGCNSRTGERVDQGHFGALTAERVEAFTRTPRRYGLHGTLKAPFRLAEHRQEQELQEAMARFSRQRSCFATPPLRLRLIKDFFCLCPERKSSQLDRLSNDCVRTFDAFRAPLNRSELAHRLKDTLDREERHNLSSWGYPYVMDRFLFHITLTGKVADARQRELLQGVFKDIFAPVLGRPLQIEGISLFLESSPGKPFLCRNSFLFPC